MTRNAHRKHPAAVLFGLTTPLAGPTLFQTGCTDYGYGDMNFVDTRAASYIISCNNNDRFVDAIDRWDAAKSGYY